MQTIIKNKTEKIYLFVLCVTKIFRSDFQVSVDNR